MSAVELFESADWSVRALDVNGEPWFVASDVAKALSIVNPRSTLALLDADERGVHTVDTLGGAQQVTTINEAGLYSLILRSRKDEARAFKRWVTHEVLPAIRRTGTYAVAAPQFEIPQTYAAALKVAAEQAERAEVAEGQLAIAAPKAQAYDEFLDADGCLTMQQTAHAVGLGRTTLFRRLKEIGVLQANNLPYQRYAHHFDIVLGTHQQNGQEVLHSTTRVKASGVEFIARKLAEQSARAAITEVAS